MNDVEMFLGLGHDPIVGSNREQDEIDSVRAGKHVPDEALVTRNVHDTGSCPIRKIEVRKPKIDRDPSLFLFLEAIGVLPRESLDEARLSVIDMACSPDDEGHRSFQLSAVSY
jgi:hypothetical protein